MRRYQMYLAAGVLALGPALALAGPLSFGRPAPKPAAPRPAGAIVRGQSPNDEKAHDVARAIKKARVGSKVQVAYQNGVAVLEGTVSNIDEARAVIKAADSVEGVKRIENRLKMPRSKQVAAPETRRRSALMQAGFQEDAAAPDSVQIEPSDNGGMPPGGVVGPNGPMPNGPMPNGVNVPGPYGPSPYGPNQAPYGGTYAPGPSPQGLPSHHVYDQPHLPNYAWPSYAAYPNSAAVNYPQQYSASAWPYIGPFYPYPQVPMGWRKAQLEWDDGYWNLNFRPRTERWWWFLDYHNW